jgi:hypothetical protein
MVNVIKNDGGAATGFLLNAIEPNSIEERVAAIEADIGPVEVVVYNLGAQIGDRALRTARSRRLKQAGVWGPSACFASRRQCAH